MITDIREVKPFLKWAGGKSKLLPSLRMMVPQNFKKYCEPFLGGGALFFDLCPSFAHLSDTNEELINCYHQVRDNPKELIEIIETYSVNEKTYYNVRSLSPKGLSPLERASRVIYLNKTCYNGLYRVNKSGVFNTPFGGGKNTILVNADNLMKASDLLKSATLKCSDYREVLEVAEKGDFIYFDPPYLPIGKHSDFKRYTKNFFYKEDHENLASIFTILDKRGCYVLLSNSYHEDIVRLYKGYNQKIVEAPRFINCKGNGRGKIKELMISNYDSKSY